MPTLPADWNEFIGLLNAKRVRYLIVGAHALAVSGRPRATQDLDIFIARSKVNVTRLAAALRLFGFADLAEECRRFEEPERMATLGKPPLRIDIMNHIDGVSFTEAWRGRLTAGFGDHQVHFLGLSELKTKMLTARRPKDMADVALIEEMESANASAAKTRQAARGAKRPPRKRPTPR